MAPACTCGTVAAYAPPWCPKVLERGETKKSRTCCRMSVSVVPFHSACRRCWLRSGGCRACALSLRGKRSQLSRPCPPKHVTWRRSSVQQQVRMRLQLLQQVHGRDCHPALARPAEQDALSRAVRSSVCLVHLADTRQGGWACRQAATAVALQCLCACTHAWA